MGNVRLMGNVRDGEMSEIPLEPDVSCTMQGLRLKEITMPLSFQNGIGILGVSTRGVSDLWGVALEGCRTYPY